MPDPQSSPQSTLPRPHALEHRLDALALALRGEAEMAPPPAFLAAVQARASARLALRWSLAVSAAASMLLTVSVLYVLLPGGPPPPPGPGGLGVRVRPDSGADPDQQPSVGNLTQRPNEDPSAALPSGAPGSVDPAVVAKAGDKTDNPVVKDAKNAPRP